MSSLATSVEDFDRFKEQVIRQLVSGELNIDRDMWQIVARANLCDVLTTTDCCAGHFEKVRKEPEHHIYIAFLMRGSQGSAELDRVFERLILTLHEAPYENISQMTTQVRLSSRYRHLNRDRKKRYWIKTISAYVKDETEKGIFLWLLYNAVSELTPC